MPEGFIIELFLTELGKLHEVLEVMVAVAGYKGIISPEIQQPVSIFSMSFGISLS